MQVVAELGRGAYAAVYRIRRDGVDYAVKALDPAAIVDDATVVAFRREATLLARVDHPAVPRVFDVGLSGGRPYLVMEYVDGRPLSAAIAAARFDEAGFDEAGIARLGADVADALAAAHRAGLVHRDVKPANILRTEDGSAHLIDFGLAASERRAVGDAAVAGTFEYSAPEQTGMLARPVDGRSDLYALGVVLFEAATGQLPFSSDDTGELIRLHATVPAPDPRARNPRLSPEFAALIGRLLAKDPDDRYPAAEQVAEHLRRFGGLTGPPHPPAGDLVGRDPQLTALRERWRRASTGAGGFALVSGVAGSGKTALAGAVGTEVTADGALLLAGRCAADDSTPAAAFRDAIDRHAKLVAALPEAERRAAVELVRRAAGPGGHLLTPLSGTLAGLLDLPAPDGEARPDQFGTAVATFLAGLARAHGGLFVQLDDVQWLDPAGCDVLRRLSEELAGTPLLLVATARTGDGEPAPAFRAACGDRLDLTVPIGPLPDEDVARLVSAYLAGAGVSPELTAEVAVRGRGNPFTVFEYLRAAAVERGLIQQAAGRYRFVHDRIREALLSVLPETERRELHQRTAVVLDGYGAADPADVYAVASHYAQGESERTPERVFSTGAAAGFLALDEHAPATALEFLEPAVAAARAAGIVPDGRFQEALGRAYLACGRADEAPRARPRRAGRLGGHPRASSPRACSSTPSWAGRSTPGRSSPNAAARGPMRDAGSATPWPRPSARWSRASWARRSRRRPRRSPRSGCRPPVWAWTTGSSSPIRRSPG